MLIEISTLPSFDFSAAKESGVVLLANDDQPVLQLLILAGDYIGLYLYSCEIDEIENEFDRCDRWQDELSTKDGYKGALQKNYARLVLEGKQLFDDAVNAAIEGDYVFVGEAFSSSLKGTMKRLKEQQLDSYELIAPLRKAYKDHLTIELAKKRKKSESTTV